MCMQSFDCCVAFLALKETERERESENVCYMVIFIHKSGSRLSGSLSPDKKLIVLNINCSEGIVLVGFSPKYLQSTVRRK